MSITCSVLVTTGTGLQKGSDHLLKISWRNLYPYPLRGDSTVIFRCRLATEWSVDILVNPGRDREPRVPFIFREQSGILCWQLNGIPSNSLGEMRGIHNQDICIHEIQSKPKPKCSPLVYIEGIPSSLCFLFLLFLLFSLLMSETKVNFSKNHSCYFFTCIFLSRENFYGLCWLFLFLWLHLHLQILTNATNSHSALLDIRQHAVLVRVAPYRSLKTQIGRETTALSQAPPGSHSSSPFLFCSPFLLSVN